MDRKSFGVLGIAVLFSLFVSQSSHTREPLSTSPNSASTEPGDNSITSTVGSGKAACPAGELRKILADALNVSVTRFEACGLAFTEQPVEKIGTILALVPDPVHTHLGLFFDRSIDAIEKGAQNSGFVFERAWMPWDNRNHPESNNFRLREGELKAVAEKEDQPGLIVFRRNGYDPQGRADDYSWDKLVVFVVGEQPTAGINRTQFKNATEYISQLTGLARDSNRNELANHLRIMGPTFSGSLYSLQQMLNCEFKPGSLCFARTLVLSGTVSGGETVEAFRKWTWDRGSRIEFASFQHPDDYLIDNFLRFLSENHYQSDRVALLTEDESTYGNVATIAPVRRSYKSDDAGRQKRAKCLGPNRDCMVNLYFPREISHVRAAYQKDLRPAETSQEHAPRAVLPLNLDTVGNDDDTVPSYSGKQQPVSQDAVLQGIVSELRFHHIENILLRSTDPLDEVFLSRYLHSNFPDARIVTLGSDLLFPREIEDARLYGELALTTYSMRPGADHDLSGAAQHVDQVFPSPFSAGVFNAMTALLSATLQKDPRTGVLRYLTSPEHMAPICGEVLSLRQGTHLFEYGWPDWSEVQHKHYECPPLHLMVLGHDGYWPVALLGRNTEVRTGIPAIPAESPMPNRESTTHVLPASWRIAELLLWLIVIRFAVLSMWASVLSTSDTAAYLGTNTSQSRPEEIAVGAYATACALLILLWPYHYPSLARSIICAVALFVAVLLVCLVALLHIPQPAMRRCFVATVVLTELVSILVWRSDSARLLTVRRSIHLSSGVSPILPLLLLLAAILWWAWHTFTGTTLLDSRRPQLPDLPCQHGLVSDDLRPILAGEQQQLISFLSPGNWFLSDDVSVRTHIHFPALMVVVSVCWLSDRWHPVRTFEEHKYEWLFGALVVVLLYLLSASAFRLRAIWQEFKGLLSSLDSFPLRRAFGRVKGFSWSPLWNVGGGAVWDFQRLLSREREAMRVVLTRIMPPPDTARLNKTLLKLLKTRERAIKQRDSAVRLSSLFTSWKRRSITDAILICRMGLLQQEIGELASQALLFAAEYWPTRKETSSENGEKLPSDRLAELTPLGLAVATDLASQAPSSLVELRAANSDRELLQSVTACEQFVARVYLSFILVVIIRMRTLIVAISGMFVLLLLALSVYPFEPRVVLRSAMAVAFLGLAWIVGVVYAQMHRDATLSHITETTPGELGGDFWLRLVGFTVLPALSLIAWEFPEVSNSLFSWLQPITEAVR